MSGYVRNDTANNIAADKVAQASDIDGEFDAIVAAFHSTTGHNHDGTTAEGAAITVLGPGQEVEITATEIKPETTNTVDIGTTSLRFQDLYLSGDIFVAGSVDGEDIALLGTTLDTAISDIAAVESDISAIQTLNTTQNSRLTAIESLNTTQNSRLTAIETLNTTQDSRLTAVESVNASQTTSINAINAELDALTNIILNKLHPVGSVYLSTSSANPATHLGIGTWVAWAQGRALVGVGTADGVAYAAGTERGVNGVTLTTAQIPAHAHTPGTMAVTVTAHNEAFNFTIYRFNGGFDTVVAGTNVAVGQIAGAAASISLDGEDNNFNRIAWDINHTHTAGITGNTGNAGSGGEHTNIQPSIGVYVWRRTG